MENKSMQSNSISPFRASPCLSGGTRGRLYLTDDDSHTLFVPEIDECYHSTKGAIQESRHIFIEAGLKQCQKDEINVLEIGFGTGLNALLSAQMLSSSLNEEHREVNINYTAIELYPVPVEQAIELNFPELIENFQRKTNSPLQRVRELFCKIHQSPWNEKVQISENFKLTKLNLDFTKTELNGTFDVIYFDAFSPEKQPEMWSEEMFQKLYDSASENAVMTTYCAKGAVRRAMKSAGFSVERLPGPPGKREILRARKIVDSM